MRLHLDPHQGDPIYRQIVEQVKFQIASGRITANQQLPSIRALAGDLKINPRTVVKAYEQLQSEKLVVMRHGQGVFVAPRRERAPAAERRKTLTDLVKRLLAEADRLGADPDEVMDVVKQVAERMESKA